MFGKTEEKTVQPVKTKKKLSRADKKQIEAAIARANRTDKKGKSAQDSIPYERMWPDGICRISDSHYTKTIQFQDINYQLSQNEDKTAIFEGWCDFLNYFDSSIHFQLSFLNLAASEETFANSISIPHKGYSSVFPFLKMGADCCLADTIFMKCHCCFIIDSVHDYMGMTFSEHCFRLLFLSVFPVMHFFQKK